MKLGNIFNTYRLGSISILAFCLSLPVAAETAVEREISNAPMPHEKVSLGAGISVQMVSRLGNLEGDPGNAKRLAQMKIDVGNCVKNNQENNRPVKAVEEWPLYLNGLRSDTYSTKNFSITYSSGWAYAMSPLDCSLLAEENNKTATLSSRAGLCAIDLVKKTTKGQCDFELHRKALPSHSGKAAAQPEALEKLKNNPAMAAAFAKMEAAGASVFPVAVGPAKRILDITCQPYRVPGQISGDTTCIAEGGNFKPEKATVLETTSEKGIKTLARYANLDLNVGESVFTPHLAGGFKVKESEQK